MKNRSFAAPVLLIGLGAMFLINNVRPELSVWHLLADWWPVLLVLFGAIRLMEVFVNFGTGRAQTGTARPMGLGWIIVAVVFGTILTIPKHLNPHWQWGPIKARGVEFFGEEFTYPVTVTSGAGKAKRIVLDNIRGSIGVTGADTDEVHLEGHKVIHAYDRNSADAVNNQGTVTFSPEGDAIYIRFPSQSSSDTSKISIDMQLTVPKGMSVEARGRSGDLSISTIEGTVDVSSQRGEVRLQDIAGNAKLDVEHCDLVRAGNVKGTVDVQGSGRDIQLDNVTGQVSINGRFSGSLEFRKLAMPLHFASDQTDLRVEKLPGDINMSLSELRATNVVGPVRFVTHERDVHLDDFSGPIEVKVGHGDVALKPMRDQQLARVDIESRNGNIEMALPPAGHFDLKATAQQGDVTNDFGDGVLSESGQGRTNTMRSANPSGASIVLNTDRGEVSVRKLE